MNKKEHQEYLKAFKAHAKDIASSREKAKSFLVRAGIHTKNGKLSKNYTDK